MASAARSWGESFNKAFKVSGAMVQSCHETLRSASQADRLHPRTHRDGSRLRETKNYSCTREERTRTYYLSRNVKSSKAIDKLYSEISVATAKYVGVGDRMIASMTMSSSRS